MSNYPQYVKVDGEKYEINTDFRNAIECNRIATDETIGKYERALAVIYILFGDKGLDARDKHVELLELAKKYLACGKEIETDVEPDMDYSEDYDYIEASFMSDYHIDLSNMEMHWWKFYNLLNGLSNSELGNCCVLNRIRNLRNYDIREIKDDKERQKIQKAKEQVALKKTKKENNLTKEQEESMEALNKLLGLERE